MTNHTNHHSPRALAAVIALLALAFVGAVALAAATQPQPVTIQVVPPKPTGTPPPTSTPGPITVYVTGAVEAGEQLLTLPHGSRVLDAVEAAGGVLAEADLSRVNLASRLRDGDQVHVPILADDAPLPTANTAGLVALNSATADELATLPGIGPVTAQAIVDYREQNGPFTDLAALDAVSGIGPRTLEALAELVIFD